MSCLFIIEKKTAMATLSVKCVTDAYTNNTKKFKDLQEFVGLKLSHEK